MKKIGQKLLYPATLILIGLLGAIGIRAVDYLYLKTTPQESFFDYTSVKSEKDRYEIGEEIKFVSIFSRKKLCDMEYNDTMFCSFQEQYIDLDYEFTESELTNNSIFEWYSSSKTYGKNKSPVEYSRAVWRFQESIPNKRAICYLDSRPTVILEYGITKTQKLRSNLFIIE